MELIDTLNEQLAESQVRLQQASEIHSQALLVVLESEARVTTEEKACRALKDAIAIMNGEEPEPAPPEIVYVEKAEEDTQDVAPTAPPPQQVVNNDPYAGIPCSGCGTVGKLHETVKMVQGRPFRLLTCRSCNNELPL